MFQELRSITATFPQNRWNEVVNQFFDCANLKKAVCFIQMVEAECKIDLRGKTIIDAGCGLGQNTILFALSGADRVYGVDN